MGMLINYGCLQASVNKTAVVTKYTLFKCKICIEVDNLSKYMQNNKVCINIDGMHKQADYMT